jgi:hypothetical protein
MIAGIVALDSDKRVSADEIHAMLERMKPYVPCSSEVLVTPDNRCGIGRLAFGAATSGSRCNDVADAQAWVAGEIYNDDLPAPGKEGCYLLSRYRQMGIERFAEGLNGYFSAAIADFRDKSVVLVTDQSASRPLFITVARGRFYFASQVKGILAVPDVPCEPDSAAVISLVSRGFLVNRRTLVSGIGQMDYATTCLVRDGKVQFRPYWRHWIQPQADRGTKELLEELQGLLKHAVQRRFRTGKCAICLSGGVDSRGIVACLDRPSEVQAFSYTARPSERRHKLGDLALGERAARLVGMPYAILEHGTRDFYGAMVDSLYVSDGAAGFVFENIWRNVREQLGAEYCVWGDECMGYAYGPMRQHQVLPKIGIHALSEFPSLLPLLRQDRLPGFLDESVEDCRSVQARARSDSAQDRLDELFLDHRVVHFENPKRLSSVPHGVIPRNPWLDLEVLRFVGRLPGRHRMRKKLFREALARIHPPLFRIPRARDVETTSYAADLQAAEQQEHVISKAIFKDNPLAGEFLDTGAVRRFVDALCATPPPPPKPNRFSPRSYFPAPMQIFGGGMLEYFDMIRPDFGGYSLLMRLLTTSVALRMLGNRFQRPEI